MAEKYDVIVVGGGPAGLSAARTAAAEGGKVLLLELQSQIGGQTQSASWVQKTLAKGELESSIVSKVKKVKLHSPHQELQAEGHFGVIVDRRLFDKLLAGQAAAAGVEIWVSCPVKDLLTKNGKIRGVRTEAGTWSERLECEVVIDATGARGRWSSLLLRKVFGQDWGKERLTVSNEYLMANTDSNESVELFFTSYLAPLGYAWIYPFGKRFAMIGIRGKHIHPDAALDEFIGQKNLPRLREATPVAAFRGQLPIGERPEHLCFDGILAVGTAAGQIYPLSGQGLKYALKCGELAGEVAVDAISEGDVSKKALSEYDLRWRGEFERELKIGKILYDALRTSADRKFDDLLRSLETSERLKKDFIKIFLALELGKRLKNFLRREKIRHIFGQKNVNKALSLYS